MTPTPEQQPPSIDSLQFDKAQTVGRKCALCAGLVEGEYYQLAGADTCPACAEKVRLSQGRPASGQILRGVLFGVAAAIGASLLYALVSYVTGYEFALLSILVGYAVGTATRIGVSFSI